MTSTGPEVRYCFRCGKRLGAQHDKCWYCGATTLRQIRPPRECPFCRYEIPHNALKCSHCGEFVDGRVQAGTGSGGQTVNFVIDKAVFNGEKPMTLKGGMRPEENISSFLSDQTREAIRTGQPELIDQDGIQALPGPESASNGEGTFAVERSGQFPAVREHIPSRYDGREVSSEIVDVEPDDVELVDGEILGEDDTDDSKYATCGICGTEIMADDNYCFHCGSLRKDPGKTKKSRRKLKRVAKKSNISNSAYYFLIAAFGIGIAVLGIFRPVAFTYWAWEIRSGFFIAIFTPVSLLLIVAAYFRKRNFSSLLLTTLVTLFWVLCFAAALLGRAFLGLD